MSSTLPPPESKSLAAIPDGISRLEYLPESNSMLASSSWDGLVRLHDTAVTSSAKLAFSMESGPLLSLASLTKDSVATGGLDGSIRLLDMPTSTPMLIGRTQELTTSETSCACSCLCALDDESGNLLASGSWNQRFCLWDIRQPSCVSKVDLPGKAFSMDVDINRDRIVVATSARKICFLDIRKGTGAAELVLQRESSLKFQTRCVQFFPDGHGIAVGSIEGRVGVEFLGELGLASTMKRYAFKCHRVNDLVFPVNCIRFHPRHTSAFATGGCDGTVVLWDGMNKKKLNTLSSCPTSVSAIDFNHDGSEIAIASSYTYEEGDREHPQDEIFVRKILDSECLPKPK